VLAFWNNLAGFDGLVILIIALLIFGKRLPEVMRSLGKGISEFKKGMNDIAEAPVQPYQQQPYQQQQGYPQPPVQQQTPQPVAKDMSAPPVPGPAPGEVVGGPVDKSAPVQDAPPKTL
jgi:sec-independent protein translocase protein TatA